MYRTNFEFGSLALHHSKSAYRTTEDDKHKATIALIEAWERSNTPIEELETALLATGLIEEREMNEQTE